ncbi:MAG TPA: adenylate/guanylate cyclase domain-containing protein [Puia sp.]|jgi:adenylate cyclase|nr:adenylate/guanylate cyclase domain-containing protein [Puia sp.]
MEQQRRLAAILFTDIIGSTAIMQKDEQAAILVNRRYSSVLKETVSNFQGEILNDYGDGSLCTFSSATQALKCAINMQQLLQKDPKVPLRIGLHVGEICFEDGKVFGDGVNVASRIQSLGVANAVLFSSEINSKIKNHQEFKAVSIGRFHFKNVDDPMEIFALANEGFSVPDKNKIEGKLKEGKTFKSRILWGILVVLIGIIAFFFFIKKPGFTGKEKSIAVLPFETISSEKGNEYINDGFTIDVIDKLSKLSGLTEVPGWARVKMYKNFTRSIIDIANELGVAAILTGTIQKQGNKIQIIADLTDVNTGKTIWHTDDNRSWGDVLTLQNEVAEKIANSLSAHLTQADQNDIKKQYTDNVDAYNYYLKGRYFWDGRTRETFDSAEANYKRAINIDPEYGLAYAGLADLYTFNQIGLSQHDAIPIAKDYVNKALSLDSTLVPAITTLGFIQSAYDYNWKQSKLTLEKAIKLDPRYSYAHIFYGNLLQYTGENTEEGIEEIKKALALDPSSVSVNWILGRNYYFAGKYDSAEAQFRKTIIINSHYPLGKAYLAYVLVEKKGFGEAIELAKQLDPKGNITNQVYQNTLTPYINAVSGNFLLATQQLNKTLEETDFKAHYHIAMVYSALHEYNLAISELQKSLSDREIFMYFIKVDPVFLPLKSDPAFKDILKKMRLDQP